LTIIFLPAIFLLFLFGEAFDPKLFSSFQLVLPERGELIYKQGAF